MCLVSRSALLCVLFGFLSFDQQVFGFVPLSSISHDIRTSFGIPTFELYESSSVGSPSAGQHGSPDQTLKKKSVKAVILDNFPEAADPKYHVTAPVGVNGFLVSREGGPTQEELTDENLFKIIDRTASDLDVNTLVWKCLGYRFDCRTEQWTTAEVFPKWKERYPDPPDMIGMQRVYSKDVDGPCLRNNQALVRSIPVENKKSYLKEYMQKFGFTGYQVAELTPSLTRRAQCTNWLLFYREELFGYTMEELRERRRLKQEKEEHERQARTRDGEEIKEEWKPPVEEVY